MFERVKATLWEIIEAVNANNLSPTAAQKMRACALEIALLEQYENEESRRLYALGIPAKGEQI